MDNKTETSDILKYTTELEAPNDTPAETATVSTAAAAGSTTAKSGPESSSSPTTTATPTPKPQPPPTPQVQSTPPPKALQQPQSDPPAKGDTNLAAQFSSLNEYAAGTEKAERIVAVPTQVTDNHTIPLPSKALQAPTLDDFNKLSLARVETDDIASRAALEAIDDDWMMILSDENARRLSYIYLARLCYDNGTSPATLYEGSFQAGDTDFQYVDLVRIIKKYTTMRKFAAYWSKVIYSLAVHRDMPPAKWQKKGYSYNTRFAAFDFFHGLSHPQAPPPKGVSEVKPTDAEIAANLTQRQIALARSLNQYRSLQPEVTAGGLCAPKPVAYVASGCGR